MNETITELSKRLQKLELHLSQINHDNTLTSQLKALQSKVDQTYSTHQQFQNIYTIINELGIWNRLNPRDDEDSTSGMTEEMKKELLVLHRDEIMKNYRLTSELSHVDVDSILRGISTQISSITDGDGGGGGGSGDIRQVLVDKELEIREVVKLVETVTVKNMIVYEEYMKLVIRENQFWVDMDETLTKLDVKVNQINARRKCGQKY